MASSSSLCTHQKAATNHDELFMQQSLLFSETLKDLKNLRKQLYSAADSFEVSYMKQKQSQKQKQQIVVVETLKDYAIKALINTVDHLGSVAFKVNTLLDEKIGKISETELQFTCLQQRVRSYQEFINQAGLSQQSSVIITPKHHKRYIFPDEEETIYASHQSRNLSAEEESYNFKNVFPQAAQATTMESPALYIRKMISTLHSPQPSLKPEKRAASPLHFSLTRSRSLLKKSPSPSYYSTNRRCPSEPRRSVSLSTYAEKNRSREFEQYSSKSKRLFKALMSMRKPRKDGTLYKILDQN